MSAAEDQADVEKVLAGDIEAYENIVRRWQGPLINLAYRFCRDRGRAEEMAQEAFLRAWRALSSWRRDAAFSTWLFALGNESLSIRIAAHSRRISHTQPDSRTGRFSRKRKYSR